MEKHANFTYCAHCEEKVDLNDTNTDYYWTNDGDRVVYHICPYCGESVEEIIF